MLRRRNVPAQKTQKVGFAVFFIVAVLGAVLLLISQVPLTRAYYDVVDTRSFSPGEPLTFYWTFEPDVTYRFEVKGAGWTDQSYYSHYLSVGGSTYSYGAEGWLVENPSSWSWNYTGAGTTQTLSVTFFHYGNGQETDQAFTPTSVEVSVPKETTYHLTYLMYVGLPLLIIGAILITITGKNVDSRMDMPDKSARAENSDGVLRFSESGQESVDSYVPEDYFRSYSSNNRIFSVNEGYSAQRSSLPSPYEARKYTA